MTKIKSRTYRYTCHPSCGKSFASHRGLSLHKTQKSHWQDPEAIKNALDQAKTEVKTYWGESSHKVDADRCYSVGQKVRLERTGVIKRITKTDGQDSMIVDIDIITSTFEVC